MCDTVIPVVFTPDENFIIQTCVVILSMLETKKGETQYRFLIIVSNNINRACLRYLDKIKNLYEYFDYQIVYIDSTIFDKRKITTDHVSSNTYYRLILADILQEYDRCMYHDGDILVNADLSEMFQTSLSDCYVAGVKAALKHQDTEKNLDQLRKGGFISFDNYIFAGDLVFNLAKIREDGITNFFLKQMEKDYPSEDQDVINYCCYGKIKFLPLKYCMLNRWLNNNALINMKKQVYPIKEIKEAQKEPAIVHFAGASVKPWVNLRTAYGEEWWRYARQILSDDEYLAWYKRAEQITYLRDWGYIKENIKKYDSVIIFGCGKMGKMLAAVIQKWGYNIKCFIDNDISKQGQEYNSCPVLSIDAAMCRFGSSLIINSIQKNQNSIQNQLIDFGVDSDKILHYIVKNEIYYMSIDLKFYAYEYRDLCIKEYGWKLV